MTISDRFEYNQAEELIDKGQFYEALQILTNLITRKHPSPELIVSYNYLKSVCLNMLGQDEEALQITQEIYQRYKETKNFLGMLKSSMIIAESLAWLGKQEKALEVILNSDNLLKKILKLQSSTQGSMKATFFSIRGMVYARKGEFDKAIYYMDKAIPLGEQYSNIQDIMRVFYNYGYLLFMKGELMRGLAYFEKALSLGKENFNRYLTRLYNAIGNVKLEQGYLDQALIYYNQALDIAIKMNCKRDLGGIFENIGLTYHAKGDLPQSGKYLNRSLKILERLDATSVIVHVIYSLFRVTLESGNFKQSEQYLINLKKIKNLEPNKEINCFYLLSKALFMKTNPLSKNTTKVEELLKTVLQEVSYHHEISVDAILHLCDLYLNELENSSNLDLLDQIQLYINQILNIAINQNLHSLLVESYLLEIKFALITLDWNTVQEKLTKALDIAEKYDLKPLVKRISIEQKNFVNQKNKWLKVKHSDKTMVELANLTLMREQIRYMLKKRELLKANRF